MACQQLLGVEDAVLTGQGTSAMDNQTIDSAKINADQAAAEDPRWKRLDGDVTTVLNDLLSNKTSTLKVKVLDAAQICSPLATTTTTTSL